MTRSEITSQRLRVHGNAVCESERQIHDQIRELDELSSVENCCTS